jgi:4'-phosphopantetheinyl transferase
MEILDKLTIGSTIIAVGHHAGMSSMDENLLYQDEIAIIEQLSPRKRSEWLASRELLYAIAGLAQRVRCLYDDFGKPYLDGSSKHISVSHSHQWCAAMISDMACGVDIQVYSDTVRRIATRFMTSEDLVCVEKADNPLAYMHVMWGAKECLYKAYGKKKLGFREHIFITSLDMETGQGFGEIIYEGIHLSYDIYFKLLPEVAWVFCLEHSTTAIPVD